MLEFTYCWMWLPGHPSHTGGGDKPEEGERTVCYPSRALFLEDLNKWNAAGKAYWKYWEKPGTGGRYVI